VPITVYLRDERGATLGGVPGEGVLETLPPPADDESSPRL
jgi:hypothetical protein